MLTREKATDYGNSLYQGQGKCLFPHVNNQIFFYWIQSDKLYLSNQI